MIVGHPSGFWDRRCQIGDREVKSWRQEKIIVGSDLLAVVKINTKGVAAHRVADTWEKRHVFEDMAKQMGDSIMRKSVTEKGPVSRRKDA